MIGVVYGTYLSSYLIVHACISRSLYIASATAFWAFRIAEDVKRPIDDTAFVPGIVSHQKPFSLVFEPRIDVAQLREVMGSGKMVV